MLGIYKGIGVFPSLSLCRRWQRKRSIKITKTRYLESASQYCLEVPSVFPLHKSIMICVTKTP